MSDARNVMVFIEVVDGRIADVSRQLVAKAHALAGELGGAVEGIALGEGIADELAALGRYGCHRVYYVEDQRLARFTSVPYARTICQTIRKYGPRVVLYGATTTGRDVAPRVASELRCGLTADCTGLEIDAVELKGERYADQLLQIRPAFGGNIIATIVSPESVPSQATVREGVMKLVEVDPAAEAEVVPEPLALGDGDFPTEVLEEVARAKAVNLPASPIIVSAGMGAADAEGIELCRRLADVIGGQLGASRPVVDAGLLPKEHQVGQTGVTVRPTLYVACGVSGSVQHMAGMKEAQRIVAINEDPDAPIFSIAHYGIVGDLREVIPRMIAAYTGAD